MSSCGSGIISCHPLQPNRVRTEKSVVTISATDTLKLRPIPAEASESRGGGLSRALRTTSTRICPPSGKLGCGLGVPPLQLKRKLPTTKPLSNQSYKKLHFLKGRQERTVKGDKLVSSTHNCPLASPHMTTTSRPTQKKLVAPRNSLGGSHPSNPTCGACRRT